MFGVVDSTDGHNSISTPAEDDFFGRFPESEPGPERAAAKLAGALEESWHLGASGLAASWAPENTCEAIFAAFFDKAMPAHVTMTVQDRAYSSPIRYQP